MKFKILLIGALFMASCSPKPYSPSQKLDFTSIFQTRSELEEVTIDLRQDKDYARGHIANAINIPIKDLKKGNYNLYGYEDVVFTLIGNYEKDAREGAEILAQAGYDNTNISPGYKEAIHPQVTYKAILGNEFSQIVEEKIFIIDTRSFEDYSQGYIRGAVNITGEDFGDKLKTIPKNKTIYVYGYEDESEFASALSEYRKDVCLVIEGTKLYDYSLTVDEEDLNR